MALGWGVNYQLVWYVVVLGHFEVFLPLALHLEYILFYLVLVVFHCLEEDV